MPDNVIQTKICTKCKAEFPATSEFFNKHTRDKSGFQCHCKICEKQYRKDNSEREATRKKRYQEANPEKAKQWRKANPEYHKLYCKANCEKIKQWREANPEYQNLYRKVNTKKLAEKKKQYARENPEKCRLINQRRRATKKSLLSDFTLEQWETCLLHFNYKDAYTGLPLGTPSQDHVIPLSKGGNYTATNIVPCERSINSSKGNRNMVTWFRKQAYYDIERENRILDYIKNY